MSRKRSSPESANTRYLFCSIAAQSDNLGDIEIRRNLLALFLERGYSLCIFTGSMPRDYIEAFEFPDQDVEFFRGPLDFVLRLLREFFRGCPSLLFAPGPHLLSRSLKSSVKSLLMLVCALALRLRGGRLYSVGRAFRGNAIIPRLVERGIKSLASTYSVRDSSSSYSLQTEVTRIPDLAFKASPTFDAECTKQRVAISLRNDLAVPDECVKSVIQYCINAHLEPIFVTQVKRDDERHRDLSSKFGVKCVLWDDKSHSEQMALVAKVYAESHAVISNRLHALLFGVAESAFPVELSVDSRDKVQSTVQPWLPMLARLDLRSSVDATSYDFLKWGESERDDLNRAANSARLTLERYMCSIE